MALYIGTYLVNQVRLQLCEKHSFQLQFQFIFSLSFQIKQNEIFVSFSVQPPRVTSDQMGIDWGQSIKRPGGVPRGFETARSGHKIESPAGSRKLQDNRVDLKVFEGPSQMKVALYT